MRKSPLLKQQELSMYLLALSTAGVLTPAFLICRMLPVHLLTGQEIIKALKVSLRTSRRN